MGTLELPSNLEDEAEATAAVAVAVKPKRVRIVLEDNPNIPPTGQFFGVNGRTYLLQSGVPALVPAELLDVLDHAIESVPLINPVSLKIDGQRDRHRYPYRRLGDDSDTATA